MRCITALVQLTRVDFPSTVCMKFFFCYLCPTFLQFYLHCFGIRILAEDFLFSCILLTVSCKEVILSESTLLQEPLSLWRMVCVCNMSFPFSDRWYWAIIANQAAFKLSNLLISPKDLSSCHISSECHVLLSFRP